MDETFYSLGVPECKKKRAMVRKENQKMKKSESDQLEGFLRGRMKKNNRTSGMAGNGYMRGSLDGGCDENCMMDNGGKMAEDRLPDDFEPGTRIFDDIKGRLNSAVR